jgi:hypothetical protein
VDIKEAIAKLQPAVGLRLNVTTVTDQTTTPTFTEVRFLREDERSTPEHDILFSYGTTRTIPAPLDYGHTRKTDTDDEPAIVRPNGQILPSGRLLTITWSYGPFDHTCLVLTMTHLDHWDKTTVRTISHFFVGSLEAIATSVAAAIAAGVWQEENKALAT